MKALPQLPTTSAAHVAMIGQQSMAVGQLERVRVPIKVPLAVAVAPCGLPQLVHQETGEAMGVCASRGIAERIQRIFS